MAEWRHFAECKLGLAGCPTCEKLNLEATADLLAVLRAVWEGDVGGVAQVLNDVEPYELKVMLTQAAGWIQVAFEKLDIRSEDLPAMLDMT